MALACRLAMKILLNQLLRLSWRHKRSGMRIYLPEREPVEASRLLLLRLAAILEHCASLQLCYIRKLGVSLPEDYDWIGAQVWREALIHSGVKRSFAWIEFKEQSDRLPLSKTLIRMSG